MSEVISSYTSNQAIDDGELVELFKNRWSQLTHGKPILATSHIFNTFSLATFFEMWNDFVMFKLSHSPEESEMFITKMNGEKIWIMDDGQQYTFMFPEDY